MIRSGFMLISLFLPIVYLELYDLCLCIAISCNLIRIGASLFLMERVHICFLRYLRHQHRIHLHQLLFHE